MASPWLKARCCRQTYNDTALDCEAAMRCGVEVICEACVRRVVVRVWAHNRV